jgi:predicted SnoaL-like aldol condensation-catalyzing enzyme
MKKAILVGALALLGGAGPASTHDLTRFTSYAMNVQFDMVRVDDGLIQEHWDVAFPNGVER